VRTVKVVVGIIAMLMGAIWFLQGINVLTAGNSPMIGDTRWAYYGGAAFLAGLWLAFSSRRRRV
jgi:hypothetical protein